MSASTGSRFLSIPGILAIAGVGIRRLLARKAFVILLFAAWVPVLLIGMGFFAMGTHISKAEFEKIDRKERMQKRLVPRFSLPAEPGKLFSQLLGRAVTEEVVRDRLKDLQPLYWRLSFYQFTWLELWVLLFGALAVGPYLVTPDIRSRSISLYFSRPITLLDYTIGKSMIVSVIVAFIYLIPCIFLYFVSFFFFPSSSYFAETIDILWRVVAIYIFLDVLLIAILVGVGSMCRTYWTSMGCILFMGLGMSVAVSLLSWFSQSYPSDLGISKKICLSSIYYVMNDINVIFTGVNDHLQKLNDLFRHLTFVDPETGMDTRLGDMPMMGSGNSVRASLGAAAIYAGAFLSLYVWRMRRVQR